MVGKHIGTTVGTVLAFMLLMGSGALAQQTQGPTKLPPSVSNEPAVPPAESGQNDAAGPVDKKSRERAYKAAVQTILSMTPDQIRDFRKKLESSRAAQSKPLSDVETEMRSVQVSLQPNEAAPTVRLVEGHVSTITFADVTGSPWPIRSFTVGDPKAFDVHAGGKKKKTNVLQLSPQTARGRSNVSVKLVGHDVPVLLTLEASERVTDYRLDIKVAARGPEASIKGVQGKTLPATDDRVMLKFLDGLPPSNAKQLSIDDGRVEAWSYQGSMYVRTEDRLLSPNYEARTSNVGGMHVYRLEKKPVLMLSRDGRVRQVGVQG